ncbi:uncharacterized protein EAF01_009589 [Botrytis porri]|uniref:FAD dependent oxidoreductase domain-containing protein n=1 Tax=Botrytis porri TaxID=87229 RepID=A0A4Z1L418_9HELO|nr:uncharacterized protein EAF01_009589 [Botrytis porri]KAF7895627.1 hypothetical protein EAF01_009589 [Botrytis porri]TGO91542.1 hypothetical protein BPOR_0025g00360 [Botrytis porri]
MPTELTKSSRILIVGGGTWAVSTALHLARRGYVDVTILDAYPIPSPISAGNDVNKIVEQGSFTEGEDDVSMILLNRATEGWLNDSVFKPYYHPTGYIVAADTPAALEQVEMREPPHSKSEFVRLETAEDFRKTMPAGVLTGDFPGWKGVFKSSGAGWVHARKALHSAAKEADRLGVKFITGSPEGAVTSLVYEDGDVLGVKTADGKELRCDRTILAAGAGANVLFDFKDQLRPTAWTLGHIKMSEDETKLYKNLPVLFNIEKGFFMEPDEDNHELKICDEHPGYCNWITGPDGKTRSIPFSKQQIPIDSSKRIRQFLLETMPHLADRPLSFARICWCADTPDRAFLIDIPPEYPSLTLAVGGSGHGFMHITSVGGFVADLMEGVLNPKLKNAFRWRPETAVNRNWKDLQGRFGGPNEIMDFQNVREWTDLPTR